MFRLLLSALAFATASPTITSCGSPTTRFQLTALDFQPANPVPGDDVFMTVEFQNPGPSITEGSAHRKVSLNGLPVVDETVALCGEATTCPLETGFNNRSTPSVWPSVSGKVVSTIQWYDATGAELLCIKTSVTSAAGASRLRGYSSHVTAEAIQHLAQPFFPHSKALIVQASEEPVGHLCLPEDRPSGQVRGAKRVSPHA